MPRTEQLDASSVRRIEFDMQWPPEHVATYLIPGPEPVLVDAGVPGETCHDALRAGFDEHGLELSDLDHLVLTHSHIDHVGQVRSLLEETGATLYAPDVVRRRCERDISAVRAATESNMVEAGVPDEQLDQGLAFQVQTIETMRDSIPLDDVDVWIEDGDVVDVGDHAFEATHAPGHHITHTCYRTEMDGETVMFSGDLGIEPFRATTVHVSLDDGVRDGVTEFLDTLERLQQYDVDRVFPGHGPVHTAYRDALAGSIADLQDCLDGCHEHLRESGSTAVQIAGNLSDGVEEASQLLPEVIGALSHLEGEGRVVSEIDDGVRVYRPA